MITIILSSLALFAAVASIGLTLWDRKRSKKRNTALMQYVDSENEKVTQNCEKRFVALEKGLMPDFEKAKEAANAVNNFNAGITGILGFDPYAALQAQRERERGGE